MVYTEVETAEGVPPPGQNTTFRILLLDSLRRGSSLPVDGPLFMCHNSCSIFWRRTL